MNLSITIALTFILGLNVNTYAQETTQQDSLKTATVKPVQTLPQFPGGLQAFYKFVNKNKQYANNKDKNNKVGTVKLSFIVEKDGSIGEPIKITQSVSEFYDNEAVRIIKAMPNWIPGTKNGEPVKVRYSVPIVF